MVSKRFSELQEELFATTKRLRLAQGAEEKLALLSELQRIAEESRRALSETDPKESKRIPTVKCPTAQALFESYSVAATEYFEAATSLPISLARMTNLQRPSSMPSKQAGNAERHVWCRAAAAAAGSFRKLT